MKHHLTTYRLDDLELGLDARHVHFCWRSYEERRPEAREGYDRLEADIRRHGMRHPVITWRGHVLIGMRRVEILRKIVADFDVLPPGDGAYMDEFGVVTVKAAEIDEDPDGWTGVDVDRIEALKRDLYGADAQAWVA